MADGVRVHPRVAERHPDVDADDVVTAWRQAISIRRRNFDPPEYYLAAGMDAKGRLLEMLGVQLEDGSILVFHAMKLTHKAALELGLG
ncbi:hypothetical protein [Actinomyces ruminis]|uniref:Uncharacterized protein n=1 Tax=Actinomyces ruminis TaxID=1937003 RepID=A0ABX4MDK8_9ACTO|nr:hypothetical protein [Actinomyces ruminis]PHP53513.1 hypothetical protein BW737_001895 [Actinomyces ruminis]